MRTAYLGTSAFAAAVLERLAGSGHAPTLVVTRPDAPRGRGRRLAPPPVALMARELGLELFQPESVNTPEARGRIAASEPETVCVCAFGALLREPLLSSHPMLNVHPSLLPRWRGAAPIERAIAAGDEVTGVSLMRPVAELDAGPVCLEGAEPIHPDDDFGSLSARLERLAGDLLVRALDERPLFHEQPTAGVTLAPKIEAAERELRPADGATALERRVRALNPHVGTYASVPGGERLGVRRARALPGAADAPPAGELAARSERLLFGTVDGALDLLEVSPAGSRPMGAAAFLRVADKLKTRGELVIPAFIFAFVMAYLAAAIQLEAILGAFAAGLVLEETDKRKELQKQVIPIADMLVPIFFVTVGAKTDLGVLNPAIPSNREGLIMAAFLILVAIFGKVVTGFVVFGQPGINRLAIGVGMIPRGEVGLVFLGIGSSIGILSKPLEAAIIMMVILTTFLAPPFLRVVFSQPETVADVSELILDTSGTPLAVESPTAINSKSNDATNPEATPDGH